MAVIRNPIRTAMGGGPSSPAIVRRIISRRVGIRSRYASTAADQVVAGQRRRKAGIQEAERQEHSRLSAYGSRLLLRTVAGHRLYADDAELGHRGGGRRAGRRRRRDA